jgi:hypothetical protein
MEWYDVMGTVHQSLPATPAPPSRFRLPNVNRAYSHLYGQNQTRSPHHVMTKQLKLIPIFIKMV